MVIKRLKNGKASRLDEIYGELVKLTENKQLTPRTILFNKIYEDERIPEEWLVSIFIPTPKKNSATKSQEHRIISLIIHALEVLHVSTRK